MTRIGAMIRLLMMALCLVPFTSTRQIAVASSPVAENETPVSPAQEEDENEREESTAKGRLPESKGERRICPTGYAARFPTTRPPGRPVAPPTPPIPRSDPFRNGLGTPYRC